MNKRSRCFSPDNQQHEAKASSPPTSGSEALASQNRNSHNHPQLSGSGASAPQNRNNHSHLPHIDLAGHYQFITFRTHDSVDDYLKKLAHLNLPNSKQQLKIDKYLDRSQKGAYLNDDVLLLLWDYLINKDKDLYELIAFCIMPNHVHILIKPFDTLARVVQKLKGGSAKVINELRGRSGKFWATDYYDKLIKNEKHFAVVYQYIKNNPVVLGEAKASPPRFYGIYE